MVMASMLLPSHSYSLMQIQPAIILIILMGQQEYIPEINPLLFPDYHGIQARRTATCQGGTQQPRQHPP